MGYILPSDEVQNYLCTLHLAFLRRSITQEFTLRRLGGGTAIGASGIPARSGTSTPPNAAPR